MKWLFLIAALSPSLLNAQITFSKGDTIFLDLRWNITEDRSKAVYFRKQAMNPNDSMLKVLDYYLESGELQMVGTYHREVGPFNQHGEFQYFYPDGTLKAVYHYNYGVTDGVIKKYFDNGQLHTVEHYNMGRQVDTIRTYYKNGQLRKLEVMNPDFSRKNPSDQFKETLLLHAFSNDGTIQVKNGTGVYKDYYLSGRKKSIIEYEEGFIHGKWIRYTGVRNKVGSVMVFKRGRFIKGSMYENGKKDIFSSLKRQAYYPTGLEDLDEFINENTGNCPDGFSNDVLVLVNISTEGFVEMEQVISGNVNACQLEEIQNLIRNMPHWVPAVVNGIYVEGSQTIRIKYG